VPSSPVIPPPPPPPPPKKEIEVEDEDEDTEIIRLPSLKEEEIEEGERGRKAINNHKIPCDELS